MGLHIFFINIDPWNKRVKTRKINNFDFDFDCYYYWNYHKQNLGFSVTIYARPASTINVDQKRQLFHASHFGLNSNSYLTTSFYFYPRWTFDTRVSSYQSNWNLSRGYSLTTWTRIASWGWVKTPRGGHRITKGS